MKIFSLIRNSWIFSILVWALLTLQSLVGALMIWAVLHNPEYFFERAATW